MKKIPLAFVALSLTACSAGFSRFTDVYSTAMQSDLDIDGSSYVIFDRVDLNSLYIRPDIGTAYDHGVTSSVATDGAGDVRISIKMAVQQYLKNQQRKNCVIDNGKEMMTGQYEFTYKCK